MKTLLSIFRLHTFVILVLAAFSCSNDQMKVSDFCESLEAGQRILDDPGWANWDMAPIYDDQGRVHLYVGRWPSDGDWLVNAQIVHMIADRPEGPYTFLDTVFQNDTISYYNPQISQVGWIVCYGLRL